MLKYLNDRIEQSIAEEERSAVTTESALASIGRVTPQNLCGFDLPSELVQIDKIARDRKDRLARITLYRDDATKLRSKLGSIGIEPMAIITAKAFERLIAEMGLFTLRPSQSGTVDVDRASILALRRDGSGALQVWFNILTGAALIAAFWMWGWDATHDASSFLVAVALIGVVWAAIGISVDVAKDKVAAHLFAKRADAWVRSMTWEQMLVALSYKDHGKPTRAFYAPNWETSDQYGAFQRQIVLPTAPPDVIDKVCRIARAKADAERGSPCFDLHIAAEADAISFKNGLDGLFDLKAIEALLEMERRIAADPILFVRGSCSVAIIAQYGDLPDERETIDRIAASEHLL